MRTAIARLLVPLIFAMGALGQSNTAYRVFNGDTDSDGFPTTAARICIGAQGTQNCYTPPTQDPPFGLNAKAQDVKLVDGDNLILFTAEASAGGSGSLTIIALLANRAGRPENLLPKVALSNQSEYRLWNLPTISAMPVFVTADWVWADAETHFANHRYRITSYGYDKQAGHYIQRDQFVTHKKYPGLDEVDAIKVLELEKAAIVARLK